MENIIKIDGKDVGFRATALTPRLYRHRMGRDIIQDLNKLKNAYNKACLLYTSLQKNRTLFAKGVQICLKKQNKTGLKTN